jgi:hypothetical protein
MKLSCPKSQLPRILGCSSNNRCKRRHMLNLQIIIMPLPEAYERDSGVRTKGSYTGVELTQRGTRSTVPNLLQLSPNPLRISYCSALWPRWPASTNSRQLGCGRPGHDSCSNGAGTVQDYAHNNCSNSPCVNNTLSQDSLDTQESVLYSIFLSKFIVSQKPGYRRAVFPLL